MLLVKGGDIFECAACITTVSVITIMYLCSQHMNIIFEEFMNLIIGTQTGRHTHTHTHTKNRTSRTHTHTHTHTKTGRHTHTCTPYSLTYIVLLSH